jgi:uncharacterized coiled-coil protein SlyX
MMTTTADLRAILDAADSVPGLQTRYGAALDDLDTAQRQTATLTSDLAAVRQEHAVATDQLDLLTDHLTTAVSERDTARAQLADLGPQLTAAVAGAAVAQQRAAELESRVAGLEATIADLRAQLAEPEPTATVWGACPAKGGTGTAAIAALTTKWGPGQALRLFCSGGLDTLPTIPDGVPLVHISWKPDLAALIAGTLDAQIRAVVTWAQALQARGIVPVLEVWHEPDVKVRKGSGTVASYVAAKSYFGRKVRNLDPTILTAHTISGWTVNPASGIDPTEWGTVVADVLGIDLDGINRTSLPYPDYAGTITAAAEFAKAHGYSLAVPEFGEPRITADSDGSKRALWITATAAQIEAAAPLYVALFEYSGSTAGYALDTTAEQSAWRAVIG